MIDTPRIIQTTTQHTAIIPLIIPRDEMQEVFGECVGELVASGCMKPGQRPAMKVARTVYDGPYEGLPDAWGEFMDWIEASGHKPASDLWECYLTNPDLDPDPTTWRTELNRPLLG